MIEGGAYSQTLATSGGLAPLTFAIVAGALPLGLTLHAGTGVIDGTAPVTPGTSSFTVQVTSASMAGARWGYSSGRPYTPILLHLLSGYIVNYYQANDLCFSHVWVSVRQICQTLATIC